MGGKETEKMGEEGGGRKGEEKGKGKGKERERRRKGKGKGKGKEGKGTILGNTRRATKSSF